MKTPKRNRRDVLIAAGAVAMAAGLPSVLSRSAWAQGKVDPLAGIKPTFPKVALNIPRIKFTPTAGGLGSIGPWGEVRVRQTPAGGLLPVFVQTSNKAGVMDLSKRRATISLNNGSVVLTSKTISFAGKAEAWSKDNVRRLLSTAFKDTEVRRSLFELRAAMVTAYPHAVAANKGKAEPKMAAAVSSRQKRKGKRASPTKSNCTSRVDVETRVSEVMGCISTWLSAEEQFNRCVDQKVASGIFGGEAAAIVACGLESFFGMFICVWGVVDTVVEEIYTTIVTCTTTITEKLIDLYRGIESQFPTNLTLPGLAGVGAAVSPGDISSALGKLKEIIGGITPFVDCMLSGKWSLARADISVLVGKTGKEVPYGIQVCVPADCARLLKLENIGDELGTSGSALIGVLAALIPEIAALAGPLGIPAAAGVAAIAAALGPEAAAVMIAIAAFLLLCVYYATVIAVQMQLLPESEYADGEVCIEHPTFVVASLVVILAGTSVGSIALAIPPVVTG